MPLLSIFAGFQCSPEDLVLKNQAANHQHLAIGIFGTLYIAACIYLLKNIDWEASGYSPATVKIVMAALAIVLFIGISIITVGSGPLCSG